MREIIHVVGTGQTGGIDSVIKNLTTCLNDKYIFNRVTTHEETSSLKKIQIFLTGLIKIIRICIFEKEPVFHMHMSYKGSFWRKYIFTSIIKLMRSKVIIHLHGSEFRSYYETSSNLTKKLIKNLISKSDKFIVLSNYWFDFVNSIYQGDDSDKIVVLRNFSLISREKISIRKPKQFVFMGAIIKRKGIYDLIEAIKDLEDIEIHICGSGEMSLLEKSIKNNNVEKKVVVHGWVDSEKKCKLIKESMALILPSYNEGLPIVILEAMQIGTLVITTPVGGIPEAISHKENGIIVNPGSINEIRKALNYVLNNKESCRAMESKAKDKYFEDFSSEKMIPILDNIYQSLLKK